MKTEITFSTWVCCLLLLLSSACLAAPPIPSAPVSPLTLAQSLALAEPPKADLNLAKKQLDRNILLDVTAKPELLGELERCGRKAGLALPTKP